MDAIVEFIELLGIFNFAKRDRKGRNLCPLLKVIANFEPISEKCGHNLHVVVLVEKAAEVIFFSRRTALPSRGGDSRFLALRLRSGYPTKFEYN